MKIFNFSKNNKESKKFAVYKALEISKNNISILSVKSKLYLKSILMKLINCIYINDDDRILIKKEFKLN